ncbi:MAG: Rap1a/Tai family immunity protein [Nitrospinaceae bacterium]
MKKYFASWLLLLTVSGASSPAWGQSDWKGMDIFRFCTGDAVLFDDTTCRAYIQGVIDAHEYYGIKGTHPKSFCVPKEKKKRVKGEATVPEWIKFFKNRLREKPIVLIVDALNDIFPCPDKAKKP